MANTMLLVKPKTKVKCYAHHWHIEESDGETSQGFCIYCGREAIFNNVLKDFHSWLELRERIYERYALERQKAFEESRKE